MRSTLLRRAGGRPPRGPPALTPSAKPPSPPGVRRGKVVRMTSDAPTPKPLSFGVNVREVTGGAELRDEVLAAERGGMDVLELPDHLGAPAPFSLLAAAAVV